MCIRDRCDGTYLEDQDFFRFSGVGRDCYLYARNKKRIQDIRVTPDLDTEYKNGSLAVKLDLKGSGTVDLELVDATGKQVATATAKGSGTVTMNVENPNKWSAETPYLYTLRASMQGSDEVIPVNVGFRKIELKDSYPDRKVIVPGKSLQEVSKILSGETDEEVRIFFTGNHIVFEFDNTMVVSRLIEGEYFKINQMLSKDFQTKIEINKKELLDCIDRATLFVKEGNKNPVIFNITDGSLKINIVSPVGKMNEEIDINKEGSDIRIGFDAKFLIDALRVIDDEVLSMYYMNAKAPCTIKDDKENYIYLILPVNLN